MDPPGRAAAARIRPIDASSVHRICSGQVVLDLAGAVKELVENALDAGATTIEVRLKEHGSELVEVSDNGCGVDPSNYEALTAKYHTSKMSKFSDLESLASFGFRGEALSSLCSLCNLSVVTRTHEQDAGTRIEYDHDGSVTSTATAPRAVGTTVALKDLFKTLPVRHKDFLRNVKREFGKLLAAMQAYALICVGVRLIVTHTAGRSPRATVVHTQGGATMRDNIVTVLGAASANALQPFSAQLLATCTATGFVSSPAAGSGRSSSDRQYFYVNGRPVDLPRVAKTLNEVYRTFNAAQFPSAVLDFRLPTDAYDVNVTPDKRRVMLHAEDELLSALHDALTAAYEPSRGTLAVGQAALVSGKSGIKSKRGAGQARQDKEADWLSDSKDTDVDEEEGAGGDDSEPEHSFGSDASLSAGGERRRASKRLRPGRLQEEAAAAGATDWDDLPVAMDGTDTLPAAPSASEAMRVQHDTAAKQPKGAGRPSVGEQTLMHRFITTPTLQRVGVEERAAASAMAEADVVHAGAAIPRRRAAATVLPADVIDVDALSPPDASRREPAGGAPDDLGPPSTSEPNRPPAETPAVLTFDLAALRATRAARLRHAESEPGSRRQHRSFAASSLQAGAAERAAAADAEVAATAELERCFKRSDFAALRVAGQFNLGFILAVLGDDLFIIDQHASDEIYNFERLRRTTCLNKQPLISPQQLDLSPAEQQSVQHHADVFRANGFEFEEVQEPGELAPKLRLTAVPFSKNTTFGVADVQELLALLDGGAAAAPTQPAAGGPFGSLEDGVVRPSRVRAMLAMRACRCSIMIGRALDMQQMERVLRHLSELKAPWNCPHGRPTMRHLADLRHARTV